jgi:hypothetical protein
MASRSSIEEITGQFQFAFASLGNWTLRRGNVLLCTINNVVMKDRTSDEVCSGTTVKSTRTIRTTLVPSSFTSVRTFKL